MLDFVKDVYDGMRTFMVGMRVTGGYMRDNTLKENFAGHVAEDMAPNTVAYDGTVEKAMQVKVADRFRGHLHNDIERCIVCMNCAKACPIDCFWIDGEKTESNRLRPSRFDIDILKCMYCGLCVFACPTGCLTMTKEWWGSQRAGTTDARGQNANLHGLLREFGVGYYTPEKKLEVERRRLDIAETKKKKAVEEAAKKAAAAKVAAEAKARAAAAAQPSTSAAAAPASPPAKPAKGESGGKAG